MESWIAKTGKGLSDGLIYEAEARLPDGVSVAGRGLQPRPKLMLRGPDRTLRTGLQTPSGRGPHPLIFLMHN